MEAGRKIPDKTTTITMRLHVSTYRHVNCEKSLALWTVALIAMIPQNMSSEPVNLAIEKEGARDQQIDSKAHAEKIRYDLKLPLRQRFDLHT
jgi:hypothetical protein